MLRYLSLSLSLYNSYTLSFWPRQQNRQATLLQTELVAKENMVNNMLLLLKPIGVFIFGQLWLDLSHS